MLRSNLATRPFYNDRGIRFGLALAGLLVALLTAYNAYQALILGSRNGELSDRADRAEGQTTNYRQRARSITDGMDKTEVSAVQDSAREANLLIGRRAFSWTDLFNRFEATLPPEVRIAAVEPTVDRDGRLLINITTISRRVEDLHEFVDQLEQNGALSEVIPRQEDLLDDGTRRAVLQGFYVGGPALSPAAPPSAASDPGVGTRDNRTASGPRPASSPRGVAP